METATLKHSGKYAWIVVLALGLMSAGTTGSYSVVAGSFLAPVCENLGLDYTSLSFYFTGTLIGLAVTAPYAGKIMGKVVGKIWHLVIACVLLIAGAAMSFYSQAWQFWLSSLIIGAGFAFTTGVAMSAVVDQWFQQKSGLAIGLAWAVNSIYMLIMSPVMTSVIGVVGWRTGYLILAGVSAILVIPSILFLRYKPDDRGMLPYGYDANSQSGEITEVVPEPGVAFNVAVKSPAFILCVVFLSLVQLTVCMNQIFPTYAVEVGFDPLIGGYMVSTASFADIFLNIVVGSTCDRFGAKRALLGWIGVSIISFVLLIMSTTNPILAIFAAGVNDVMYVVAGTGLTCVVLAIFGSKDFGRIFAWICAVGYIVGAFGMPVMTGIYGITGSFQMVFAFCILLNIIIAILLVFSVKFGEKLPRE